MRAVEIKTQKRDPEAEHGATRIVRNYLFRIFDKLGVSTRVELVLYCFQAKESRSLNAPAAVHAGQNGSNGA
jgi:hypothetical protein